MLRSAKRYMLLLHAPACTQFLHYNAGMLPACLGFKKVDVTAPVWKSLLAKSNKHDFLTQLWLAAYLQVDCA